MNIVFITKKIKGFTLIELMIAVAIVGILAAVAYPSYVSSVAKSNRTEGQRELMRLANLEEQFYSDNRAYTTDMTQLTMPTSALTENGYYKITASVDNTNGTFTLTATAQGAQATNDASCKVLTINETGKKTPTSGCWEN